MPAQADPELTDISGETPSPPDRPPSPKQMEGQTKQKVNRTNVPGPEAATEQGDLSEEESQQQAPDESSPGKQRGEPSYAQPPAQHQPPPEPPGRNPFLTYDGATMAKDDPAAAYYNAQQSADLMNAIYNAPFEGGLAQVLTKSAEHPQAAFNMFNPITGHLWNDLLPGSLDQSVHNIWEQNAASNRQFLGGKPVAATSDFLHWAFRGNENAARFVTSQGLPLTANPMNLLGGMGIEAGLGRAGIEVGGRLGLEALPRAMESGVGKYAVKVAGQTLPALAAYFLSGDQGQRQSAMTWAGMTAMMVTGGHLPGPMREFLSSNVPAWSHLEARIAKVLDAKARVQMAVQAPWIDHKLGYLDDLMKHPTFEGSNAPIPGGRLSKADAQQIATPGKPDPKEAASQRSLLRQMYRAGGVTDKAELEKLVAGGYKEVENWAQDNRLTAGMAKVIVNNPRRMARIMGYDLRGVYGPDGPLRDPRIALSQIEDRHLPKALQLGKALKTYTSQLHAGEFGEHEDPGKSVIRHWFGLNRTDQMAAEQLRHAWIDFTHDLDGNAIRKAMEGKAAEGEAIQRTAGLRGAAKKSALAKASQPSAAYQALDARHKYAVDMMHAMLNEERLARLDVGRSGAVSGYFPGVKKGELAFGKGVGSRAPDKHRVTGAAADEHGHLILTQAYPTHDLRQQAIEGQRSDLVDQILNPQADLPGGLRDAAKAIRNNKDRAQALEQAQALAKDSLPDFDSDARSAMFNYFGKALAQVHMDQSLLHLKESVMKDGMKGAYEDKEFKLVPATVKKNYMTVNIGNQRLNVHKDLAELIDNARQHVKLYNNSPAWWKGFQHYESAALQGIFYSPAIHAWNLGARHLAFWGAHPYHAAQALLGGRMGQGLWDHEGQAQRVMYWRNQGVLAGSRQHVGGPDAMAAIADSVGERYATAPYKQALNELGPLGQAVNGILKPGRVLNSAHTRLSNLMWNQNDHFGANVAEMTYKQSLPAFKKDVASAHKDWSPELVQAAAENHARSWAVEQANSWMGFIRPEVGNPMVHDISKLAMLAPSWWRSLYHMFVPHYAQAGVEAGPHMIAQTVMNDIKVIAAGFALWKGSGAALNYLTSGHFQDHNEQQNKDKLEVTRPWAIKALQDAHWPGTWTLDKTTGKEVPVQFDQNGYGPNGEVITMENPYGRVQKDIAGLLGYGTNEGGLTVGGVGTGAEGFMFNRISPLLESLAGVANIDVYSTIHNHNLEPVVQSQTPGVPSIQSALTALLYATPGGSNAIYNVQQAMANQKNVQDMELPGGVKLPTAVASLIDSGKLSGAQVMWQMLTGANAPYVGKPKTPGQGLAWDEVQKLHQAKQDHESQLNALQAEFAGGGVPLSQVLSTYKSDTSAYNQTLRTFFKGVPEDATGPQALLAEWDATYKTRPDGSVDWAATDQAQANFTQAHSQAEMQALSSERQSEDQQYPFLKLYHNTLDAYRTWEQNWATNNGVDVNQLTQTYSQYEAAYGNTDAQQNLLDQSPWLQNFLDDRKYQFEVSPVGIVYGMVYNSPWLQTALTYSGLDPATVEQQVQTESPEQLAAEVAQQ